VQLATQFQAGLRPCQLYQAGQSVHETNALKVESSQYSAYRGPAQYWRPWQRHSVDAYNIKENIMLDWNNYRNELTQRVGEIASVTPDLIKGYQTVAGSGKKSGRLDAKTAELISLAVAVTTHCDGCIAIHSKEALKAGATKEEISDALAVAVSMNAGAALVYSARVFDAVDALQSGTGA
jgi:AhpD family alkylhydroperoxidase